MSKLPKYNASLQEQDPEKVKQLLHAMSNHHKHAELYTHEQGQTVSIPLSSTFYVVTGNYTAGESSGTDFFTINATNGTITVGDRGRGLYKIMYTTSFSATRLVAYHAKIFVNGSEISRISFRRDITTANSFGDATCFGYCGLEPGDVVDIRYSKDSGASATVSIDHANLILLYIAGY
jgi:hypothetical protein